jgi:DNA mismatch endonuclease (patch repair protein)
MGTMRKPTPEVSARMKLVKTESTKPEIEMSRVLRKLHVRVRRNVRSLPGTPDFVLPDRDVAVFVHGCFWHSCPR